FTKLHEHIAGDVSISLPRGSSLVAETTEDARQWTWRTPAGRVSLSWISRLAHQYYWGQSGAGSCGIPTQTSVFLTTEDGESLYAVSGPLGPHGAGILVRFDHMEIEDRSQI